MGLHQIVHRANYNLFCALAGALFCQLKISLCLEFWGFLRVYKNARALREMTAAALLLLPPFLPPLPPAAVCCCLLDRWLEIFRQW